MLLSVGTSYASLIAVGFHTPRIVCALYVVLQFLIICVRLRFSLLTSKVSVMHETEEQAERNGVFPQSAASIPQPPVADQRTDETAGTAGAADVESTPTLAMTTGQETAEATPGVLLADVPELSFSSNVTTMKQAGEHDPLARRPKIVSIVTCAVFGVLFLAAAAGCWWFLVRTLTGQQLDNMAFDGFADNLPAILRLPARVLSMSVLTSPIAISVSIIIDIILGIVAITIVCVRKRWLLLVQLAIFATVTIAAAELLKHFLPRTMMDQSTLDTATNTSPSGHVAIAAVSACVLLCAVPHAWRAVCAIFASLYTAEVAFGVIAGGFHRPGDTIAAMLLVFGMACIMLATTRSSAMDAAGTRLSSASIQIVASLMITIGVCALLYASYVVWQLAPGIMVHAMWAVWAAHIATNFIALALPTLGFGIILALRHATASPLSRLGMLGAPPAPPSRKSASR